MPLPKPYQPLLLRLLHNVNAALIIGAIITGFLVYDSWDGRFGSIGITRTNRALIDIHGTFGFFISFVALPIFLIYCWNGGRKRLIQASTLKQLGNVGTSAWWYALQRVTNTLVLISALFSVISGKFQDENWLPQGELNHIAYYIHLIAWVVIVLALSMHLLMSAKVGGSPLLLSMLDTTYRKDDSPGLWRQKIMNWFQRK